MAPPLRGMCRSRGARRRKAPSKGGSKRVRKPWSRKDRFPLEKRPAPTDRKAKHCLGVEASEKGELHRSCDDLKIKKRSRRAELWESSSGDTTEEERNRKESEDREKRYHRQEKRYTRKGIFRKTVWTYRAIFSSGKKVAAVLGENIKGGRCPTPG